MDFSELSEDQLKSRIADYEDWGWRPMAKKARSELSEREESNDEATDNSTNSPNERVRPNPKEMDELSEDELRGRIAEYREWGWDSLVEKAEAELSDRGEDEEELSYEERLSEANLSASEELRCKSVSLPNE